MGISKHILLPRVSLAFLSGVSPVFPRGIFGPSEGAAMADGRITKRVVDGLKPQAKEFAVWDSKLPGFGVRVRPTGAMSYVVVYRAGSGRGAPVRRSPSRTSARSHQRPPEGEPRASWGSGAWS
jgi:hypothetical protein